MGTIEDQMHILNLGWLITLSSVNPSDTKVHSTDTYSKTVMREACKMCKCGSNPNAA